MTETEKERQNGNADLLYLLLIVGLLGTACLPPRLTCFTDRDRENVRRLCAYLEHQKEECPHGGEAAG